MRKHVLIITLLLFSLFSCAKPKPQLINGIDYKKAIIGKWKAVTIGNILKQYNIDLPGELEFYENNKFYYMFTKFGIQNKKRGRYSLNLEMRPVEIDFRQYKPKRAKLEGIVRFKDIDTMEIIFYYKSIMRRVYKFVEGDYQIYKRVRNS